MIRKSKKNFKVVNDLIKSIIHLFLTKNEITLYPS